MTQGSTIPDLPPADHAPWVETRPGGLFFVNALLVAPVFMVLLPVLLNAVLGALLGFDRPSRLLDPIPLVAAYVAPVLGWLAVPAAGLVVLNLRVVDRPWARAALWIFLAVHVGVLGYTLFRWLG